MIRLVVHSDLLPQFRRRGADTTSSNQHSYRGPFHFSTNTKAWSKALAIHTNAQHKLTAVSIDHRNGTQLKHAHVVDESVRKRPRNFRKIKAEDGARNVIGYQRVRVQGECLAVVKAPFLASRQSQVVYEISENEAVFSYIIGHLRAPRL